MKPEHVRAFRRVAAEETPTKIGRRFHKRRSSRSSAFRLAVRLIRYLDTGRTGGLIMSINCIRTLLEDAVQSHSDKAALVFNERSMTYAELFSKANQVACYLDELGLPKNSRIGVFSNKGLEQVIAILGILSTDYVLVPLTRLLKPEPPYTINNYRS